MEVLQWDAVESCERCEGWVRSMSVTTQLSRGEVPPASAQPGNGNAPNRDTYVIMC
jgi:hypothetical protein